MSDFTAKQVYVQVVKEKGLPIIHPDTMIMSRIIGIEVESHLLRQAASLDDEAKLEIKMELVQKFHSRIDQLLSPP